MTPIAAAKAGRAAIAACQRSSAGRGGTLDRELEAALHDRAERDVGDGEAVEGEPRAAGQVASVSVLPNWRP